MSEPSMSLKEEKKFDPTLKVFMFSFKYNFFLEIHLRHTHKLKRLLAKFQWLVWIQDIIRLSDICRVNLCSGGGIL